MKPCYRNLCHRKQTRTQTTLPERWRSVINTEHCFKTSHPCKWYLDDKRDALILHLAHYFAFSWDHTPCTFAFDTWKWTIQSVYKTHFCTEATSHGDVTYGRPRDDRSFAVCMRPWIQGFRWTATRYSGAFLSRMSAITVLRLSKRYALHSKVLRKNMHKYSWGIEKIKEWTACRSKK